MVCPLRVDSATLLFGTLPLARLFSSGESIMCPLGVDFAASLFGTLPLVLHYNRISMIQISRGKCFYHPKIVSISTGSKKVIKYAYILGDTRWLSIRSLLQSWRQCNTAGVALLSGSADFF
uniref:Uncharacterized protein n=1 Tax=Ixodes ricinus TaxID=34613 RepID=A0A6B0UNN5_IXORI